MGLKDSEKGETISQGIHQQYGYRARERILHVLLVGKDGVVGLEVVLFEESLAVGNLDVELSDHHFNQTDYNVSDRLRRERASRSEEHVRGGCPCKGGLPDREFARSSAQTSDPCRQIEKRTRRHAGKTGKSKRRESGRGDDG
jgi:hypothetical protein